MEVEVEDQELLERKCCNWCGLNIVGLLFLSERFLLLGASIYLLLLYRVLIILSENNYSTLTLHPIFHSIAHCSSMIHLDTNPDVSRPWISAIG